jgi:hypothetical protein
MCVRQNVWICFESVSFAKASNKNQETDKMYEWSATCKLASKLHVHSVNFAAKLVHTRRALSSIVINSHQEPVSGQARNTPDPH